MRRKHLAFVALAALASLPLAAPSFAATATKPAPAKAAPAKPAPAAEQAPQEAPVTQMALTDDQVQSYLDAQPDIDAVTGKMSADAGDKPDPKAIAALDDVAKKHKFASFAEYGQVSGNITLVVDGVDPQTKKYVGADVLIKQQIATIQADKKAKPADKKAALAELTAQLKAVKPLQFAANVDVVLKHIDAIMAVMQQDDAQGGGQPPKQ